MTIPVTVRENERVDLSQFARPTQTRDALLASTAHLREAVFRVNRRGHLAAKGLVGIVQTRGITVEILPKVATGATVEDDRQFLLHLLTNSGLLPYRQWLAGNVQQARIPLLEIVIRQAAEELQALLGEHGPPRRYVDVDEELDFLTGRLDTARTMRQLPSERHRVHVHHSPVQGDNPLSRLLKALARSLFAVTGSRRTRGILGDALAQLELVGEQELTEALLTQGRPTDSESHWDGLWNLAAGLHNGLAPNPAAPGTAASRVLVFSLDDIFERVMRRALTQSVRGESLVLARRTPPYHYLEDLARGEKRLRLRPDLLLTLDGSPLIVADAKWKRIRLSRRGGVLLDRSDVYQVTAYMNRYDVEAGILFMPAGSSTLLPHEAPWYRTLQVTGSTKRLHVLAVDVAGLVARESEVTDRALRRLKSGISVVTPSRGQGSSQLAR